MKKSVRWITRTAMLLALLCALQALTKPLGQIVTGTCVNAVLAVAAICCGAACGLTVAAVSPVLAFLFGIAPNAVTVLPIMIGNACYVLLLWLFGRKRGPIWRRPAALVLAASVKFSVLYLLVVRLICGPASTLLLGKKVGQTVLLAPPMLEVLPTMFAWPQLITALLGGTVALVIAGRISSGHED